MLHVVLGREEWIDLSTGIHYTRYCTYLIMPHHLTLFHGSSPERCQSPSDLSQSFSRLLGHKQLAFDCISQRKLFSFFDDAHNKKSNIFSFCYEQQNLRNPFEESQERDQSFAF